MKEVQTGMNNHQNTGVQILQGDGALITVIVLVGMILASVVAAAHYRAIANTQTKISEVLSKSIVKHNDEELTNNVFNSAIDSGEEQQLYNLISTHEKMFR